MGPSYATVIVPIAGDRVACLKRFIRAQIDPQPGVDGALVCQPQFPFDAIETLHFMSFLVLDADAEEGLPAQLVLDATFDGDRDAFLARLVAAAGPGMHAIYSHCVGYAAGDGAAPSPKAFVRYLADHDVGADTYFSGSYGRTTGQIKSEHALRGALRRAIDRLRASPLPMPSTYAGLQASLLTTVREDPSLAALEQPSPLPWLMLHGKRVLFALGAAIAAVLTILGGAALLVFGIGAGDLYAATQALPAWALGLSTTLFSGCPVAASLVLFAALVLGFRTANLAGDNAATGTRRHVPLLDAVGFLAWPLWLASVGAFALVLGLVGVELLRPDTVPLPDPARAELASYRVFLLGDGSAACLRAFVLFCVGGLALAGCAYVDTSLAMALDRLPRTAVMARRLARSAACLLEAAVVSLMAVAVLWPWRAGLQLMIEAVAVVLGGLGVVLAAAVAGLLLVYAAIALLLLVVRYKEIADLGDFQSASNLMSERLGNREARAREEGGINTLQNHLASLTYVKPGKFRLAVLKVTLALIGLLARILYNQGDLGDISTILSARWVVIDNGRRLIFLDNYGGGWESYLNEFIDMSAVIGLNAIWTNTFIKWPLPSAKPESSPGGGAASGKGPSPVPRYAFPPTRFYTSDGARDERPFKTYVRYSQIETLAWYGAYHTQSIRSINTNTEIRQDLFSPLRSHEIDRLVGKL